MLVDTYRVGSANSQLVETPMLLRLSCEIVFAFHLFEG